MGEKNMLRNFLLNILPCQKLTVSSAYLTLLLLLFNIPALAAAGDLDPTFGNGGKLFLPAPDNVSPMELNDIAVQPDGKIVGVGRVRYGAIFSPNWRAGIVRLNTDGSFDAGFGNNGRLLPPITTHVSDFCALDLQAGSGKIVIACRAFRLGVSGEGIAVYRYNPDGSPDTSFDGDGFVYTTGPDGWSLFVRDVVVQPDGKILVGGDDFVSSSGGYNRVILTRYNADGSLDASFGSGGRAITPAPEPNRHDYLVNLILLPNGKIIASAWMYTNTSFLLYGFNANGTPDASFGTNGEVKTQLGNFFHYGGKATLLPDGKFIYLARTNDAAYRHVFLRYDRNGALDTTFGTNGIVPLQLGENIGVGGLVVQPDGKFVMAGSARINTSTTHVAVVRTTSAGMPDPSFGTGGVVITGNFGIQGNSYGGSAAIQPDGKILVSGLNQCCELANNPVLARYLNPDSTEFDFDGDGKADVGIFRPNAAAEWYWLNSSNNQSGGWQFGNGTDKAVPADYDGDGKTDMSVFRNGDWYRLNSSNNEFVAVRFGQAGDAPVPSDYDGDSKADLAVYRAGWWYVLNSADNSFRAEQFGISSDKPIPGADFDGDGKADLTVYRDGIWYVQKSREGFFGAQFGIDTDKPVAADYDSDGRTDIAVYRPADGTWYLLRSHLGFTARQFGISTDKPVPADYDGDGKTDLAVYRDGDWYLLQSTAGFAAKQFGTINDLPVANSFVP